MTAEITDCVGVLSLIFKSTNDRILNFSRSQEVRLSGSDERRVLE